MEDTSCTTGESRIDCWRRQKIIYSQSSKVETRLWDGRPENRGSITGRSRIFFSPLVQRLQWGPNISCPQGNRGNCRGVELSSHLPLVPMHRKPWSSRSTPPPHNVFIWGSVTKQTPADNFREIASIIPFDVYCLIVERVLARSNQLQSYADGCSSSW
jgi:hypothetical protein